MTVISLIMDTNYLNTQTHTHTDGCCHVILITVHQQNVILIIVCVILCFQFGVERRPLITISVCTECPLTHAHTGTQTLPHKGIMVCEPLSLTLATFLSPSEKFLRNTRKVPATGTTPSHWPGRNRPIQLDYNHTHAREHMRTHKFTFILIPSLPQHFIEEATKVQALTHQLTSSIHCNASPSKHQYTHRHSGTP